MVILGFHEAIGDTIALSVSTPEYLEKIKKKLEDKGKTILSSRLVKDEKPPLNDELRKHQQINLLMKNALSKVKKLNK